MNIPTGYTALDLVGYTDKGNYAGASTYVQNDLVHYQGDVWRCKIDDTTGITPSESANWTLFMAKPTGAAEAMIAPIESATAIAAHAVGSQLVYNDTLYEVISAIAIGDTLMVGTNIQAADTITEQISEVKSDLLDRVDWESNAILGAHNILPNNAVTTTTAGVTYTVNPSDKTISTANTSTANGGIAICESWDIKEYIGQDLIINGVTGGGANTYRLYCNIYDSSNNLIINPSATDGDTEFTVPSNADYASVGFLVYSGQNMSGKTIKPMIRLASDTDDTYVPYAMTNRELTEVVDSTGMSYPVQSVYELSASKYIYKCGKIVNISIDIKSLTAESYPGGQNWTTVGSGFPKPHKNVVQNIPAPFADGKLMQAYLTTAGNLQVRGGSVNTNWYTLQLTYICD